MIGGEFLQTFHLPEAKHGPFSSLEWQEPTSARTGATNIARLRGSHQRRVREPNLRHSEMKAETAHTSSLLGG
jgi:hypothetical protein